jgi:hypothetical protein
MKISLFVTIILALTTQLSFAADQNQAYELVCKPLPFASDRAACTTMIRKYNFFQDEALNMCVSLSFSSDIVKCTESIGNKTYLAFEITECSNENFESGKMKCLATSGTVSNGASPCKLGRETETLFKSMLYDLRSANYRNVDARLQQLITQSQNCPN